MDTSLNICVQNLFSMESTSTLPKCKILTSDIYNSKNLSCPTKESYPTKKQSKQLQAKYIKKISEDLHFSKEVVKDRGLACLPYHEWDSKGIYDVSDILPNLNRKRLSTFSPIQHKLCHMRGALLFRPKNRINCSKFGKSIWMKPKAEENQIISYSLPPKTLNQDVFLTETETHEVPLRIQMKRKSDFSRTTYQIEKYSTWNSISLKNVEKTTGDLFVDKYSNNEEVKSRLCQNDDLHFSDKLIREENMINKADDYIQEEKKTEMPLPVYYKLPNYCTECKKVDEICSRNKTAESLVVKHFELTPTPKLQDIMNPKAGKYIHSTENKFEEELYSGTGKIIHQKGKKCIVMKSNNLYDKHLQETFPRSYQEWSFVAGDAGAVRWTGLPSLVQDEITRSSSLTTDKKTVNQEKEAEKVQNISLNGRQVLQNIVAQWRAAWTLSGCWKEATLEQLKKDLSSLHSAQKISALITIASAAVSRPQNKTDSLYNGASKGVHSIPDVPEDMQELISSALKDEDALVKMAAALCQYVVRAVSDEARTIMFAQLHHGTDADSWAAAQCLALEGEHNHLVVKRILTQLFEVTNKETEEQACYLLSELSESTSLVHAMLAEALNSQNWRHRIVACRALSRLHGLVSWDLRNKLIHLMWEDWKPAVQQAAAQSLGKMGYGKDVHDQLRENLEKGNWKEKVQALSLIGWLQLMTAQLLPGFLQCFSDDFVAVRKEACVTAGLLKIKDEMVQNCLYKLIQSDPLWKIQAFAIKAVGKIGQVTPQLKDLLLWALKSTEQGVRMETCHCIAALHICDTEIQRMLQDMLILEPYENVRRVVSQTITYLNIEHNGDQEMILKIQQQVSKLCQKELLIPKILNLDDNLKTGQKMQQKSQKTSASCQKL